jgi:hypothetical protein
MCTRTPTFSAQRWRRLDRCKCRNYYSKLQLSAVFSEILGNDAVGIELKAVLEPCNLLIPLNAASSTNYQFA